MLSVGRRRRRRAELPIYTWRDIPTLSLELLGGLLCGVPVELDECQHLVLGRVEGAQRYLARAVDVLVDPVEKLGRRRGWGDRSCTGGSV